MSDEPWFCHCFSEVLGGRHAVGEGDGDPQVRGSDLEVVTLVVVG
ncbi:MAG TPA: hypothetical protein VFJ94_03480 [Intrasporangium sp.]|nr:hypothetical protein [Intrasporangium sp.]HET7397563.1 hypothetical protein [Intrasporangium sp.]